MAYTTNAVICTTSVKTACAVGSATSAWTPSSSTTTNLISVLTAPVNGCRVTGLFAATTDTAANDLFIVVNGGGGAGTLGIVGQVDVPLSSGTLASKPVVDLFASTTVGLMIDNNGKRFLHLQASDVLYIGLVANMTAAKTLFITAVYEPY